METQGEGRDRQLVKTGQALLIKTHPELTGDELSRVYQTRNDQGQPAVGFEIKKGSQSRFAQMTTDNKGSRLCIVLNGDLRSAPVIRNPITGGRGVRRSPAR